MGIFSPGITDGKSYRVRQDQGQVVTGVIVKEDQKKYSVASNLLTPNSLTEVRKRDVEIKSASKVSSMPAGLLDVLTKDEILDLQVYVESGGYHLPDHIEHHHHGAKESEK